MRVQDQRFRHVVLCAYAAAALRSGKPSVEGVAFPGFRLRQAGQPMILHRQAPILCNGSAIGVKPYRVKLPLIIMGNVGICGLYMVQAGNLVHDRLQR